MSCLSLNAALASLTDLPVGARQELLELYLQRSNSAAHHGVSYPVSDFINEVKKGIEDGSQELPTTE